MADKVVLQGVDAKGYGKIPKLVMQDEELTIEAKAIYAYLASFAGSGNNAFPSVDKICRDLGISKNRFYKHRKKLVEKNYVHIDQEVTENKRFQRNIYTLISNPWIHFRDTGNAYTGNAYTGNEDTNNNNTNNNNINNNNEKNIVESYDVDTIPYEEVIDYLNKKTNSSYRSTTKKTRALIRARFDEGFKLEDFKKVIDTKANEWLNNNEMSKYLRPETLFGNKFEGYLNQKQITANDIELYHHQITSDDIEVYERLKAEGWK